MFEYNVKIKKVSGRLNESVLPQKNLVVKSKSELSMRNVLKEAAKYLLENYGLELIDALIVEKAPRIDGKWYNEAGAAEAAQKNHFIKRHQDPANWGTRGTLERLRDEITKELVNSVYFRAGDDIHYLELPDGIAITLDGDINVYGSTSSGMHTIEDSTGATWSDQSYDADAKASDNVFTYDFDEEDFSSLVNFRHNLDNEISYGDYDEDDYDNDEEMYDNMRIWFEECVDSMKSAMEKLNSFNDIEKYKQHYCVAKSSEEVFDELKTNVMNVIKEYMKMNKNKAHSMMGMKKMARA